MPTNLPHKDQWIGERAAVLAHLNMIQTVIARMATSSASCKTWCVALVGALVSLAGATRQPAILDYCVVVLLIFAFIDVRYLAQEKAFRDLFDKDLVPKIRSGDYGLADAFRMGAATKAEHMVHALKSWAIWAAYGGLLLAYIVARAAGWLALLQIKNC